MGLLSRVLFWALFGGLSVHQNLNGFYLWHLWHFSALRGRWVDLDSRAVNCHRHYCKRYLPVHQTKGQTRQFKDRKKGNQPLNCSSPPTSRATASPHSSTFQWLLMMAQSNKMNISLIIALSGAPPTTLPPHSKPPQCREAPSHNCTWRETCHK